MRAGASSANFDHLKEFSPKLHRLAVLAKRYFAGDANTSLIKSRRFGEYMVKEIAARSGELEAERWESTVDLLRRLRADQFVRDRRHLSCRSKERQ